MENKTKYIIFSLVLGIFLISLITISSAAIAIDNVMNTSASAASFTLSNFVVSGSNTFMLVGVSSGNKGQDVTDVAWGATALAQLAIIGNGGEVEIWGGLVGTGTEDVVVNTDLAGEAVVGAVSFTGVNQTTPYDGADTAIGTSANPAITITSEAGDWVFGAYEGSASYGSVANTAIWGMDLSADSGAAAYEIADAGSETITFTMAGSAKWEAAGVNINAAAPDPCAYSGSGNWAINCSDNCTISENVDLLNNNLTLFGVGEIKLNANITNWDRFTMAGISSNLRCEAYCIGGNCFSKA